MKKFSWAAVPLYLFTVFFVLLPLVYVLALSFMTRNVTWGVDAEFTLENYKMIFDPVYLKTFGVSLEIAFLTTLITAFIGYPFGYFMAKLTPKYRNIAMMLVIIPFWTNALIRIYGWMIILRPQGLLNNALIGIGLLQEPVQILYTLSAVVLGMVYSLLPFMILSVYSSALKLDPTLVDASRDLGANRFKAFWTVSFQLTMPGLLSGFVFVFVPSVGLFFISDLMGGGKIMLLGNLIENQLVQARNMPFGAALAIVMMAMTLLIIWLYRRITKVHDLEGLL